MELFISSEIVQNCTGHGCAYSTEDDTRKNMVCVSVHSAVHMYCTVNLELALMYLYLSEDGHIFGHGQFICTALIHYKFRTEKQYTCFLFTLTTLYTG